MSDELNKFIEDNPDLFRSNFTPGGVKGSDQYGGLVSPGSTLSGTDQTLSAIESVDKMGFTLSQEEDIRLQESGRAQFGLVDRNDREQGFWESQADRSDFAAYQMVGGLLGFSAHTEDLYRDLMGINDAIGHGGRQDDGTGLGYLFTRGNTTGLLGAGFSDDSGWLERLINMDNVTELLSKDERANGYSPEIQMREWQLANPEVAEYVRVNGIVSMDDVANTMNPLAFNQAINKKIHEHALMKRMEDYDNDSNFLTYAASKTTSFGVNYMVNDPDFVKEAAIGLAISAASVGVAAPAVTAVIAARRAKKMIGLGYDAARAAKIRKRANAITKAKVARVADEAGGIYEAMNIVARKALPKIGIKNRHLTSLGASFLEAGFWEFFNVPIEHSRAMQHAALLAADGTYDDELSAWDYAVQVAQGGLFGMGIFAGMRYGGQLGAGLLRKIPSPKGGRYKDVKMPNGQEVPIRTSRVEGAEPGIEIRNGEIIVRNGDGKRVEQDGIVVEGNTVVFKSRAAERRFKRSVKKSTTPNDGAGSVRSMATAAQMSPEHVEMMVEADATAGTPITAEVSESVHNDTNDVQMILDMSVVLTGLDGKPSETSVGHGIGFTATSYKGQGLFPMEVVEVMEDLISRIKPGSMSAKKLQVTFSELFSMGRTAMRKTMVENGIDITPDNMERIALVGTKAEAQVRAEARLAGVEITNQQVREARTRAIEKDFGLEPGSIKMFDASKYLADPSSFPMANAVVPRLGNMMAPDPSFPTTGRPSKKVEAAREMTEKAREANRDRRVTQEEAETNGAGIQIAVARLHMLAAQRGVNERLSFTDLRYLFKDSPLSDLDVQLFFSRMGDDQLDPSGSQNPTASEAISVLSQYEVPFFGPEVRHRVYAEDADFTGYPDDLSPEQISEIYAEYRKISIQEHTVTYRGNLLEVSDGGYHRRRGLNERRALSVDEANKAHRVAEERLKRFINRNLDGQERHRGGAKWALKDLFNTNYGLAWASRMFQQNVFRGQAEPDMVAGRGRALESAPRLINDMKLRRGDEVYNADTPLNLMKTRSVRNLMKGTGRGDGPLADFDLERLFRFFGIDPENTNMVELVDVVGKIAALAPTRVSFGGPTRLGVKPEMTDAELEAFFVKNYQDLLGNEDFTTREGRVLPGENMEVSELISLIDELFLDLVDEFDSQDLVGFDSGGDLQTSGWGYLFSAENWRATPALERNPPSSDLGAYRERLHDMTDFRSNMSTGIEIDVDALPDPDKYNVTVEELALAQKVLGDATLEPFFTSRSYDAATLFGDDSWKGPLGDFFNDADARRVWHAWQQYSANKMKNRLMDAIPQEKGKGLIYDLAVQIQIHQLEVLTPEQIASALAAGKKWKDSPGYEPFFKEGTTGQDLFDATGQWVLGAKRDVNEGENIGPLPGALRNFDWREFKVKGIGPAKRLEYAKAALDALRSADIRNKPKDVDAPTRRRPETEIEEKVWALLDADPTLSGNKLHKMMKKNRNQILAARRSWIEMSEQAKRSADMPMTVAQQRAQQEVLDELLVAFKSTDDPALKAKLAAAAVRVRQDKVVDPLAGSEVPPVMPEPMGDTVRDALASAVDRGDMTPGEAALVQQIVDQFDMNELPDEILLNTQMDKYGRAQLRVVDERGSARTMSRLELSNDLFGDQIDERFRGMTILHELAHIAHYRAEELMGAIGGNLAKALKGPDAKRVITDLYGRYFGDVDSPKAKAYIKYFTENPDEFMAQMITFSMMSRADTRPGWRALAQFEPKLMKRILAYLGGFFNETGKAIRKLKGSSDIAAFHGQVDTILRAGREMTRLAREGQEAPDAPSPVGSRGRAQKVDAINKAHQKASSMPEGPAKRKALAEVRRMHDSLERSGNMITPETSNEPNTTLGSLFGAGTDVRQAVGLNRQREAMDKVMGSVAALAAVPEAKDKLKFVLGSNRGGFSKFSNLLMTFSAPNAGVRQGSYIQEAAGIAQLLDTDVDSAHFKGMGSNATTMKQAASSSRVLIHGPVRAAQEQLISKLRGSVLFKGQIGKAFTAESRRLQINKLVVNNRDAKTEEAWINILTAEGYTPSEAAVLAPEVLNLKDKFNEGMKVSQEDAQVLGLDLGLVDDDGDYIPMVFRPEALDNLPELIGNARDEMVRQASESENPNAAVLEAAGMVERKFDQQSGELTGLVVPQFIERPNPNGGEPIRFENPLYRHADPETNDGVNMTLEKLDELKRSDLFDDPIETTESMDLNDILAEALEGADPDDVRIEAAAEIRRLRDQMDTADEAAREKIKDKIEDLVEEHFSDVNFSARVKTHTIDGADLYDRVLHSKADDSELAPEFLKQYGNVMPHTVEAEAWASGNADLGVRRGVIKRDGSSGFSSGPRRTKAATMVSLQRQFDHDTLFNVIDPDGKFFIRDLDLLADVYSRKMGLKLRMQRAMHAVTGNSTLTIDDLIDQVEGYKSGAVDRAAAEGMSVEEYTAGLEAAVAGLRDIADFISMRSYKPHNSYDQAQATMVRALQKLVVATKSGTWGWVSLFDEGFKNITNFTKKDDGMLEPLRRVVDYMKRLVELVVTGKLNRDVLTGTIFGERMFNDDPSMRMIDDMGSRSNPNWGGGWTHEIVNWLRAWAGEDGLGGLFYDSKGRPLLDRGANAFNAAIDGFTNPLLGLMNRINAIHYMVAVQAGMRRLNKKAGSIVAVADMIHGLKEKNASQALLDRLASGKLTKQDRGELRRLGFPDDVSVEFIRLLNEAGLLSPDAASKMKAILDKYHAEFPDADAMPNVGELHRVAMNLDGDNMTGPHRDVVSRIEEYMRSDLAPIVIEPSGGTSFTRKESSNPVVRGQQMLMGFGRLATGATHAAIRRRGGSSGALPYSARVALRTTLGSMLAGLAYNLSKDPEGTIEEFQENPVGTIAEYMLFNPMFGLGLGPILQTGNQIMGYVADIEGVYTNSYRVNGFEPFPNVGSRTFSATFNKLWRAATQAIDGDIGPATLSAITSFSPFNSPYASMAFNAMGWETGHKNRRRRRSSGSLSGESSPRMNPTVDNFGLYSKPETSERVSQTALNVPPAAPAPTSPAPAGRSDRKSALESLKAGYDDAPDQLFD